MERANIRLPRTCLSCIKPQSTLCPYPVLGSSVSGRKSTLTFLCIYFLARPLASLLRPTRVSPLPWAPGSDPPYCRPHKITFPEKQLLAAATFSCASPLPGNPAPGPSCLARLLTAKPLTGHQPGLHACKACDPALCVPKVPLCPWCFSA